MVHVYHESPKMITHFQHLILFAVTSGLLTACLLFGCMGCCFMTPCGEESGGCGSTRTGEPEDVLRLVTDRALCSS